MAMLIMILTALPKSITLSVGDTVNLNDFPRWRRFKRLGVKCEVVDGDAVSIEGDLLIAKNTGISVIICKFKRKRRGIIVRVLPKEFKRPKPIILRVGQRKPLPNINLGKEYKISFLVKPPWLAKIINDSIEGLAEGRGIVQVHVLKGDRVIDEFPIPIVVEGYGDLEISPKMAILRVGEALKFSIIGDYREADWIVIPKKIGFISKDGLFTATSPGKGVIIAKVKLKNGRITSVKAFVKILKRP